MGISPPSTAYPGVEESLREQLREAALDHDAFSLRLHACLLSECRATCCHDGAYLTDEERRGIIAAVEANRGHLARYGWTAPRYLESEGSRPRTVTLVAAEEDLAPDFPRHFPRSRCVFLDAGHRCVLQRLASDQGLAPWWWKPVSCWMHPLILRPNTRGGRPLLTLARPGNDPAAAAGYPGFGSCTPCGMAKATGIPAWQALRPELEMLERISGRALLKELSADDAPA
jgi:hypothetical protein